MLEFLDHVIVENEVIGLRRQDPDPAFRVTIRWYHIVGYLEFGFRSGCSDWRWALLKFPDPGPKVWMAPT